MDMEEGLDLLAEAASETAAEEVVRNFATVGAVYADGVTLIFDGEEEATEKHYLCNTNVYFSAGDRVRILADAGTYIVEYVVGSPRQTELHGVPSGGSADQILTKSSGTDYDTAWADAPKELPSGGSTGQVLTKTATGNAWQTPSSELPSGGTNGQVLTKKSTGPAWEDVPTEIPASGTTGYVLTKNASGFGWAAAPTELPSGGSNGQVLTKTSSGLAWQTPASELPSGGSTGQVLTKTSSGTAWQAVPTEIPASGTTGYVLTKNASGFGWAASPPAAKIVNYGATGTLQTNDSYILELKTGGTAGTAASEFYIRMGTTGTWHKIQLA